MRRGDWTLHFTGCVYCFLLLVFGLFVFASSGKALTIVLANGISRKRTCLPSRLGTFKAPPPCGEGLSCERAAVFVSAAAWVPNPQVAVHPPHSCPLQTHQPQQLYLLEYHMVGNI